MVPRQGEFSCRFVVTGFLAQTKFCSPASTVFLTCSAFGGNRYGHWLAAEAAAQDSALTAKTRAQWDRSWRRYQRFLHEVGIITPPSFFNSSPMSGLKSSRVLLQQSGKAELEMRTTRIQAGRRSVPDDLMGLALDGMRAQIVPPSAAWRRSIGLTNLAA